MPDIAVSNRSLPGWRPAPEPVTNKTVKLPQDTKRTEKVTNDAR